MPHIYGLTGGIASGKTTVSKQLVLLGAYCVDTDIIAREVVAPGTKTTQQIKFLLGESFFFADGNLNRPKIKQVIFNTPDLKQAYEDIIHPAIRRATLDKIQQAPKLSPYTLVVVPLLFEKGFDVYTDQNIVVDISEEIQIARAVMRKPSDEPVIRQIIQSQMPRNERLKRADYVIENNGSLSELMEKTKALHEQLKA